jgi:site-specific recombinase XerD
MSKFSNRLILPDEMKDTPLVVLIGKARQLLNSRQYSRSTLWHYNERFRDLLACAAEFNADKLTDEFIRRYILGGAMVSPKLIRSSVQRKALLNVLATSIGTVRPFQPANIAESAEEETREMLLAYWRHLALADMRESTIKSYVQVAAKLLIFLNRVGKKDPSAATPADIMAFVGDLGSVWSPRSMRIVPTPLKHYLAYAGCSEETSRFAGFRTPQKSKPVQAMGADVIESLWGYIESDVSDLRTKAMLSILLSTGMRPSDITEMKLDDIDWRAGKMSFVQKKTGESMTVELFPTVGSTIARYLTGERPKGTGLKYVFLTQQAPFRNLSAVSCNYALKTAMAKRGIEYIADGLHCPRAVRRSVVSRMVAKGVTMQKAAASLGHVGEASIGLYTELDTEKMRSLCLPVPGPMRGWLV